MLLQKSSCISIWSDEEFFGGEMRNKEYQEVLEVLYQHLYNKVFLKVRLNTII